MNKGVKMVFEDTEQKRKEVIEALKKVLPSQVATLEKLFGMSLFFQAKGTGGDDDTMPSKYDQAEGAGVDDFIWRLWRIRNDSILPEISKHLELLVDSPKISMLKGMHASRDAYNKEKNFNDKLFELYIATLIAPLATSIDIDNPKNSESKSRPDIIAMIDGRIWAFECKMLYSNTPILSDAYLGLLEKAYQQLSNVPTNFNIPIVGFKEKVTMDLIWPDEVSDKKPFQGWSSDEEPRQIMSKSYDAIEKGLREKGSIERYMKILEKHNKGALLVPAALNLITATTPVKVGKDTPIHIFKELRLLPFMQIASEIHCMANRLNDQLHFL
jgi:hypothetical protein